jgi:hypothetical protein
LSDVIDFNELKNKVRDKDIDDFENYIFSLYSKMGQGTESVASINRAVIEYMEKNNISMEKFMEIQNRLMERYGVSMADVENQYNLKNNPEYEKYRKQLGFMEKYKGKVSDFKGFFCEIKNDRNQISIYLDQTTVIIASAGRVDLSDNELNEFLVSYKKLLEDQKLTIKISEQYTEYDY